MRLIVAICVLGMAVILMAAIRGPLFAEKIVLEAARPLASLSTPAEVESFLINKSRTISNPAEMNRWIESTGFVTVFNIFPPDHLRAGESEIIAS